MKAKYIQSSGRAIAVLLLSGGLLCSGPAGLRAAELQVQREKAAKAEHAAQER